MTGIEGIKKNLNDYKRKYYVNKLLRGILVFATLLLSYYLIIAAVEYAFRFDSLGRTLLLFSFIVLLIYVGYKWIGDPLVRLLLPQKQLSDEEAALQIGAHFPEISDKLLNTIQLQKSSKGDSSLIMASIVQRTSHMSVIPFPKAIDLSKNKVYLKYLAIPVVVIALIALILPQLITESTGRIIKFQTEFVPKAPFTFQVENGSLTAFRNEDFVLKVSTEGNAQPNQAFAVIKGRKIKLDPAGSGKFTYNFQKIQQSTSFFLEASGFASDNYEVEVLNRPNLRNYNVLLDYPAYTKRPNDNLSNSGNLNVPEGTNVTWQFGTLHTDGVDITFSTTEETLSAESLDNQLFQIKKKVLEDDFYEIKLKNEYASNKENIGFNITVLKDQLPQITLEPFQDTTMYNYIILGGSISDDYGISQLQLKYKKLDEDNFQSLNLAFASNQNSQSYFHNWKLDSFALAEGEGLEYYVQVWDNDGVNGWKSAKSGTYTIKVPTRTEIKDQLEKESQAAENQIDKSVEKAEELRKQLEEIDEKLKSKKEIDWQDEKLLEELVNKREKLEEEIKKLQEQNQQLSDKNERFNEQSPQIKEKVEKLQELMNELLDEETKKLYEELKKLLEEKGNIDEVQEMVDKIDNKEENMEKELERALELFKRMKLDYKLEEIVQDLDETIEKQKELAQETEEGKSESDEAQAKQEELKEQFEEIKESIEELEEINQTLEEPTPLEDTDGEQSEVEEKMDEAKENLENNKKKKASESQKGAAQKMDALKQKMMNMQQSMEMTMMEENLDHLRDILDNLVKLSFDQEQIMNDFKRVNQSDPRFIKLSQDQLQLKDDAAVIEDSLLALANRVFQIKSFVTREVDAMNDYMDESIDALKERNKPLAVSKEQFTMTSMNNLALLLDDVMQQMQQAMADAKGMGKGGKKGKKQQMPGVSELQKELNQKIDDLKKSGKSGRELSEDLAKLAAEQEMIRQQLNEMNEMMEENGGKGAGGKLEQLLKKMEETETDLVNKRLTEQMQRRQEDILTRLLKAEDSMRERELDDEREGKTAKELAREVPPAYEEYIKAKEKEIELLKTIPLQLNPYYKKEVNEYFRRLGNQPQL